QPAFIELSFLASGSAEARARYGAVPWLGAELVVVSDAGDVWVGPAAFLMCLWALVDYREWSYRLSGPSFAPLAERFFHALSSRRRRIAAFLEPSRCPDGSCRAMHPAGAHSYR
ncbi:MAG: hypothetical protein L6Q76_09195, partial [Polyangiaceae bacterium]|nr:hypothetical protein [Polyangiaceae bacterium]